MKRSPNYTHSVEKAQEVLSESEIDLFPVDLRRILKRFSGMIKLRSYSAFMKKWNIDLDECKKMLGSPYGMTRCLKDYDECLIYFNDFMPKETNRFTIAHELGLIFLRHFDEQVCTPGNREQIDNDLYKTQEGEANCFARNLLSPTYHTEQLLSAHGISLCKNPKTHAKEWIKSSITPVTLNLKTRFDPKGLLESAFQISALASKARLDLLPWDINQYTYHGVDSKITENIKHSVMWNCTRCHTERLHPAIYCTQCRQKGRFQFSGDVEKHYMPISISENGHFNICPVCGNSDFSEGSSYCKICGAPLLNPCRSSSKHFNHPEARFCAECGASTNWAHSGWIDRINHDGYYTGGLQEMEKEKTVEFDKTTFRVTECPRCHNKDFSIDAEYCKICGLSLVNRCVLEQIGGDYREPEYAPQHANLPDARYCECCGKETIFLYEGVLKSYNGEREKEQAKEFDRDVIPF